MKSINTLFVIAAIVFAGSASHAQTADVSGVTADTAATAASINALADAINALHGRVDALEAGETSSGNVTLEDLVDTNYCISFFGNIGATANGGDFARIGSYNGSLKLAITSTSAGTLTTIQDNEFELGWNLGFVDPDIVLDASLTTNAYDDGGAVVINSLTAGILSITAGGDTDNFNLSPDGNVILGTSFDTSGTEAETSLVIGMRCI